MRKIIAYLIAAFSFGVASLTLDGGFDINFIILIASLIGAQVSGFLLGIDD